MMGIKINTQRRQQGASMLLALIALLILSVSAVALIRSVDSGTLIIGNLGFKRDATQSGAIGAQNAMAWLESNQGALDADFCNRGYYASSLETLDPTGSNTPATNKLELIDWDGTGNCSDAKAGTYASLIIIDYLQLMVAGFDNRNFNREQEISTISRSLKSIAKELDVPIIALSQLSRAVESRGGSKKPQLSDLRESGAIEQVAEMVMVIYRPDYYGLTEDEAHNNVAGLAEIIVAKNRNGALKNVHLKFISQLTKFVELDVFAYNQENVLPSQHNNPSDRITMKSRINDVDDVTPF